MRKIKRLHAIRFIATRRWYYSHPGGTISSLELNALFALAASLAAPAFQTNTDAAIAASVYLSSADLAEDLWSK
ncbi:hypothetical protein K474DRAFT_1714338 [Panus rudis PR-1116 ss-1]|nr:hypothetical protein K474DRAFT_1714338 [Panus rudis PR-1116 ss-1]